jgi:hypothetical protein
VNNERYDCYQTEEQKLEFVQRIVNKGIHEVDQQIDQEQLLKLTEAAIETGYLYRNGGGPELTLDGVDAIKHTKYRQHTLGALSINAT